MDNIIDWQNEISIDDLPEVYQTVARLIGISNCIILAKEFSGSHIYFPKEEKIYRQTRDITIRRDFNGGNYKELSKKYGLTDSRVREIVAKKSSIPSNNKD